VAGWLATIGHDRPGRAARRLARPADRRRRDCSSAWPAWLCCCRSPRCRPASPRTACRQPPDVHTLALIAAAVSGAGWLLLGGRCSGPAGQPGRRRPADARRGLHRAGSYAVKPLPTVGALLLLAAGMGIAWTGNRLIPRA
jgi:hypothetical protein